MDPKRRARLILIVGILLALVTGGLTYGFLSSAQNAAPAAPPATTDVVVAARQLPARTALTAQDVKVAKVNVDAAPVGAFKDPKAVIGNVLAVGVTPNEPLLPSKLAPKGRAFTVLPPGVALESGTPAYRVMAITVPDSLAVGGVLEPGDGVDLMYVFPFDPAAKVAGAATGVAPAPGGTPGPNPNSPYTTDTVAKIIVGPILILARDKALYTIRVEAKLAEELAYVQAAGGTLQFLLRAPADDRVVDTTGATFDRVFPEFKFPIPRKVQPAQ